MTASELKEHVLMTDPDTHFFDRKTMKFFGDTMRNFGVRGPVDIVNSRDKIVSVYELYRRKPVNHGNKNSFFFNAATFEQEFIK
ncbi:MAG: hypothetical protein ACTSYH_03380 [Candidatus Heimdallarchaeaceae archaeon]